MSQVPDGWTASAIRDVSSKPSKLDPVGTGRAVVHYVDIGLLDGPVDNLRTAPEVESATAPSRCRQVIASGDTLYSTVRPYLRKIAHVSADLDGEFASTGYSVLRPAYAVDPKFLYFFCLSPQFEDQILPFQKGVSYPAVLDREVRAQRVWYPEITEQRRIVEILEDHLSRLDAASSSLALNARRVDAWARSRADQVLWNSGWQTARVSDLIREPMRNGRSDRAAPDGISGVRTLTLTAVTSGEFTEQNTKVTTTDRKRAESLWLEDGDIFVQRANTPDLVGTTRRYSGAERWAIFPDLLIRVRADEEVIDSRLLAAGLRSERAHRSLRAKAKGLAGSMPKIDQVTVGAAVVPVPSRDEQGKVVAELEDVDARAAALGIELRTARRRGDVLRRAVLAAAFSGKLTGRHTDVEVIEERAEQLS